MTEESKRVITYICQNRLWEKYDCFDMPSTVDVFLAATGVPYIKKTADNGKLTIYREFASEEDAAEFYAATRELVDIQVKTEVRFGGCGTEFSGRLFGGRALMGKDVFIEVNRNYAREVFSSRYFYHSSEGVVDTDFLSYINRNGGKHWDDMLGDMRWKKKWNSQK